MKQCNWFLCSWHITELVPCTDLLRMKSLDTTCYKTVSWFCTNGGSVHFTRLRVHLFTRQHHILKNTWSIKNPDNLVCGSDPLDWSKSDPSDLDCPGYPTHFQPLSETMEQFFTNWSLICMKTFLIAYFGRCQLFMSVQLHLININGAFSLYIEKIRLNCLGLNSSLNLSSSNSALVFYNLLSSVCHLMCHSSKRSSEDTQIPWHIDNS